MVLANDPLGDVRQKKKKIMSNTTLTIIDKSFRKIGLMERKQKITKGKNK